MVGATSASTPPSRTLERALADVDERHRFAGVRGVRLAGGLVFHLLDIAVVGGDQGFAADLVQRLDDTAHAGIQALHGLDRGVEHAAVATMSPLA